MIDLRSGIRVSGASPEDLWLIDGSLEYKKLTGDMQAFVGAFVENALIPKLQWRRPTEAELCIITTESPIQYDLQILKYEGELYDFYGQHIKTARPFIQRMSRVARYTTTHHKDGSGYGLHFDQWAAPRLIINIGNTSRFFCFLNQPIQELSEILSMPPDILRHRLKQGRLGLLTQFPLVLVRIRPSHAWFMPNTKDVLHDGLGQVGLEEAFISIWGVDRVR